MAKGCIQKRKSQPRRRLRRISHHGNNIANEGEKPSGRGMDDGLPSVHLRTLLDRERRVLPNPAQLPKGIGVIGWSDRNREAAWICAVGRRLGMEIDAVSLAVSIFDKVVMTIRVPPKYVNCVSSACVHIARKLCEDDEDEAWMFIDKLQLSYSPNELKRMEMSVLVALSWDALIPSVERFVSIFLESIGGTSLLSSITQHIEVVLQDSTIHCEYSPSIVALTIVSHVLEATSKHWLPTTQQLIKMCKADVGVFVRCRERVAASWTTAMVPRLSAFSLLAPFEDADSPSLRTTSPQTTVDSPCQQITSPRLQATPC